MAETMSKEQASNVLESDILRRVAIRGGGLILSGLLGAATVMWLTGFFELVRNPTRSVGPDLFLQPTVPFAETVDPVLPTLVTALLALSVVKVGKFAPGFVVGTASLCGFLASMWATMSTLALVAPGADDRSAANDTVAGIALGAVAVAVTVVLAEVLPLSRRVRQKQLEDSLAKTRAVHSLATKRSASVMSRFRESPYSSPAASWTVATWYLATIAMALTVPLAWALGAQTPAAAVADVWIVAASLSVIMSLELIALHGLARFRLEVPTWKDERTPFAFILVIAAVGASALTISFPLATAFAGPFIYGLIPGAWSILLLISGLLPLWARLPKWGWFGQVVMAQRGWTLQRREDRLSRVQRATEIDAMPRRATHSNDRLTWRQRLLGRE
ncbi:hypothetical protein [Microbacterium sp.]|uniref:hypothetical protein n=1 Tax=Microbacterium sp. TaxID=51671 RepID=UPI002D77F6F8|nr:hypothetical protein [Microbacterium sp.]HET6301853.1 hypothetical protein [Microbacterium sp.]